MSNGIKEESVTSLGDYLECVGDIARGNEARKPTALPPHRLLSPYLLWFRGISNRHHDLIPSLYRQKELFPKGGDSDDIKYTLRHFAEDVRTQHYIAKNYHFFSKIPTSRVEWLEVMQHHSVKTRVLDWSESSLHSAIFAVEAFLDGLKYTKEKRQHSSPCVWTLNPQNVNREIFQMIEEDKGLFEALTEEIELTKNETDKTFDKLKDICSSIKIKDDNTGDIDHLRAIVNLASINDELNRDRARLKQMLLNDEQFILSYLLSRIYSDGYLLEDRKFPPLAIVEPYHSVRIRSQKGVFTVFPHYKEHAIDSDLRKSGLDPNAMQRNAIVKKYLWRINIDDPERLASDLISNGILDSWLYPELPTVAYELEGRKVQDS